MHAQLLRQIKDIQNQADHILSQNDPLPWRNTFAQFALELKSQIQEVADFELLKSLVNEIPDINSELKSYTVKKGLIDILLGATTILGFPAYSLRESDKSKRFRELVHTTQGKFASIEMILRNS